MYSAHSDISGLQPVPAHLFGTRQAVFLLMRAQPGPEEVQPRPRPPEAARPTIQDLLFEDRFVF